MEYNYGYWSLVIGNVQKMLEIFGGEYHAYMETTAGFSRL